MFNLYQTYKNIKNKFIDFSSYMLGLDKQLANAKNDAERNKILVHMVEVQKQRIEELEKENKQKDLRIKELETQIDLTPTLKETNRQAEQVIQKSQAMIEVIKK